MLSNNYVPRYILARLTNKATTICFSSLSNWTNPIADPLKLPHLQLPAKLHDSCHPQPQLVAQKLASLFHQLPFSLIHMSPLQQPNGIITPTHISSLQQPLLELPTQIKTQLKNQRFVFKSYYWSGFFQIWFCGFRSFQLFFM